ncbi:[protein-PII] uridylyltransferase [Candidatus Puniceispirillum sp.]|uniref:[protein-PII] uridylyltransferase n=1 Tax=Candidatus Puniceispirillum sp. TaxID=2026719 RepID=UPI003F699C01
MSAKINIKDTDISAPKAATDKNSNRRGLWHRWVMPLVSVMETHEAPLDMAEIEAACAAFGESKSAKRRAAMLALLRDRLATARTQQKGELTETKDGVIYVGLNAWMIDQLLEILRREAVRATGGKAQGDMAIVAVGGYGRGELAPHSDIDILFLVKNKVTDNLKSRIEYILYMLWDLGLKVGHATRDAADCIDAARQDQTILTGLLEMRHVAGNEALSAHLSTMFRAYVDKTKPLQFVEEKLAERDLRHQRLGDTRYVVEPNIKDGKGGLRDLHTLLWTVKYAYRATSLINIVDQGILRASEARRFAAAQRFLWTVRCHLHLYAGRPEERLDFEAQMVIAPLMGFADRGGLRAVERFMKRYYLAARDVGNLTRIFCAAMETDFRKRRKFFQNSFRVSRNIDEFQIQAGRISLSEDVLFRDAPLRILKLFQLAQEHDADIHPQTLHRITRAMPSIDAETRADPAANALFLDILTSSTNPERILRLMNESGVIGRFLPDFGRIVAMMQFDMYHSYTVDEHTIKALGILHRIETGGLTGDAPVASEAMPEIGSRRALFVAVLLHDIAKGRGGDHSILGAEVAHKVCPRLGLTPAETETVSWLVRHHLLMSKIAFRYDLNDPKTIEDFAAIVQSPEQLRLLLILTVADIRAVGPTIWNGWKAALMRDLFSRTDAVLKGADPTVIAQGNAGMARALAFERLVGQPEIDKTETDKTETGQPETGIRATAAMKWSAAAFAQHADNFPSTYWTGFDVESHCKHATLCQQFRTLERPLLIDLSPDQARRATEMTVITVDDPGLFSRIAGAVAAVGVNIASARITTCSDGTVLDVFYLQTIDNQVVDEVALLTRIRDFVTKAAVGKMRIADALSARWQQTPKRIRRFPVPPRVLLSNNISKTHSVIEVNGRDFPGFLYKITRCMVDLGLQIQSSSISTYGERVVDVFYVKDIFGLQILNEARQHHIRNALLAVLQASDETDADEIHSRGGDAA